MIITQHCASGRKKNNVGMLDFDWVQRYASFTSALVESRLTQEDCMVCRAEGATVAPQGITA